MLHISLTIHTLPVLDAFARGGGGGSGGGGGGGGGDGLTMLFLLGYVPSHYATNWAYRRISARTGVILGIIVGTLITAGIGVVVLWAAFIVGLGAVVGVYSGVHNWWTRILSGVKKSKQTMAYAARTDPVWHEQQIEQRIKQVFYGYQEDWSNFDVGRMRMYASEKYVNHMQLLMQAIYDLGRRNVVSNPQIIEWAVIEAVDLANDDNDNFTVYIKARAQDRLLDRNNSIIYQDDREFTEYWHFDRQGNEWMLDGIEQATEDKAMMNPALHRFAGEQGMYFSPDMGWLLLPQRGQLFGQANFKRSDINNHIIGNWEGLLVQLYTYVPVVANQRADNYLIGQITLPKSYGGIIVKRNQDDKSWLQKNLLTWNLTPSGYQKVQMEWPDFNRRYSVYATDMDKVTSFELLNPAFMADLHDKNLPISIEVVDDTVYFYCLSTFADRNYAEMLEVLRRAYKELKR
jgi:hypothetical protein